MTSVLSLILTHFAALAVGILLGYALAVLLGEMHRARKDLDELAHPAAQPSKESVVVDQEAESQQLTTKRPRRPTTKGAKLETVALVVVFAVALTSSVLALINQRVDAQRQDCFNAYANQLAASLEPRQRATAILEQQEFRLYQVTLQMLRTPEDQSPEAEEIEDRAFRRALANYVAAYQQLERERLENPWPEAPREVCPE